MIRAMVKGEIKNVIPYIDVSKLSQSYTHLQKAYEATKVLTGRLTLRLDGSGLSVQVVNFRAKPSRTINIHRKKRKKRDASITYH